MEPGERGEASDQRVQEQVAQYERWIMLGRFTAGVLTPLGALSIWFGISQRTAIGNSFIIFELVAFIVTLAGIVSWFIGPGIGVIILFMIRGDAALGLEKYDHEHFPALMYGLPFLATAIACFALMLSVISVPEKKITNPIEHYAVGMTIAMIVSLMLSLFVPALVAIGKKLRQWSD
jgi:hypothetical protein